MRYHLDQVLYLDHYFIHFHFIFLMFSGKTLLVPDKMGRGKLNAGLKANPLGGVEILLVT